MAQNDIGIDLGTTTIIIAQEGKGVVLNQPSVVAMDTRKNSVLEAGDKALAMVGRTPNYISAIFPLKDGVISDHTMTRELICRFVRQVYSSHMVKPRVAVCVPAAITGIESDAVVEAVVAAGARQVYLIDEPIAAAPPFVRIFFPTGSFGEGRGGLGGEGVSGEAGGKCWRKDWRMADVIFECCCGIELEGVEDGGVVYVRCPVCGRRSKPIPIIGTV